MRGMNDVGGHASSTMRGAGEEEGLNICCEAMRGKCLGVKARTQPKGSKEVLKNEQGQRQRPGDGESAAAGERGDRQQSWRGGAMEGVCGGVGWFLRPALDEVWGGDGMADGCISRCR